MRWYTRIAREVHSLGRLSMLVEDHQPVSGLQPRIGDVERLLWPDGPVAADRATVQPYLSLAQAFGDEKQRCRYPGPLDLALPPCGAAYDGGSGSGGIGPGLECPIVQRRALWS